VDLDNEQGKIIACLKNYFRENNDGMAVLISDWLVPSNSDREANALARECQAEFGKNAFGTIAIVPHPRRVADIDRTIDADCTDRGLENILGSVIDRLDYLTPPTRPSQLDCSSIFVRPLRTGNEGEFRDYFVLRHHVYTIMGYLDEEIEDSRSKLEMNEADVHAIHVGAFYRNGAQLRLVGTARVVTNSEADKPLQTILEAIAGDDPVARQRLDTPYLLGLPIFQSHGGMNSIIHEVFTRNQSCGELSRVIVAPEFRGNGISKRLIAEALRRSISKGAQRLFLECLQVHEALYEQLGFHRIRGVVGPVVDVGRTMIAMEMCADTIKKIRANASQVA
jgi:predicted GNAT family N-acyltransferase